MSATSELAPIAEPVTDESFVYGEILRAATIIMAPGGGLHELRIPAKDKRVGTLSGYFDRPEALAEAAMRVDGQYPGIYITLNPCDPDLLARAAHRLKSHAEYTTKDEDILRRYWFPVDFDPLRKTGISSSDYEHCRAISVAMGTFDELHSVGWPDPLVANSGNGAHLLYRCDLPNTPEVTAAVKQLLAEIAARCGTADVSIDLSVFNASRIWKLYGTMSCKGDSIAARPHRRSCLYEAPDPFRVLTFGKAKA